jgi:hypothetical protein
MSCYVGRGGERRGSWGVTSPSTVTTADGQPFSYRNTHGAFPTFDSDVNLQAIRPAVRKPRSHLEGRQAAHAHRPADSGGMAPLPLALLTGGDWSDRHPLRAAAIRRTRSSCRLRGPRAFARGACPHRSAAHLIKRRPGPLSFSEASWFRRCTAVPFWRAGGSAFPSFRPRGPRRSLRAKAEALFLLLRGPAQGSPLCSPPSCPLPGRRLRPAKAIAKTRLLR